METALHELSEMDELAAQSSPIHALHPAAKLASTILYIIVTVSFGKYQLSALIPMVLWPILLFQISGIPVRICLYKLRIVLPLVMAVGLLNPVFDRQILFSLGRVAVSGGVVSMFSLMLKGVLCLMASFLLMATTKIDSLCAALRAMHVPRLMVTLLLLTYRYVGVMTEELSVMTDAYHLRAPGQKGIHISAWGSFLGQLLLRSMDKAQEIYSAMLLRGYHEHFHYVESRRPGFTDALYILLSTVFFLAVRYLNISGLLGSMVMG